MAHRAASARRNSRAIDGVAITEHFRSSSVVLALNLLFSLNDPIEALSWHSDPLQVLERPGGFRVFPALP